MAKPSRRASSSDVKIRMPCMIRRLARELVAIESFEDRASVGEASDDRHDARDARDLEEPFDRAVRADDSGSTARLFDFANRGDERSESGAVHDLDIRHVDDAEHGGPLEHAEHGSPEALGV